MGYLSAFWSSSRWPTDNCSIQYNIVISHPHIERYRIQRDGDEDKTYVLPCVPYLDLTGNVRDVCCCKCAGECFSRSSVHHVNGCSNVWISTNSIYNVTWRTTGDNLGVSRARLNVSYSVSGTECQKFRSHPMFSVRLDGMTYPNIRALHLHLVMGRLQLS